MKKQKKEIFKVLYDALTEKLSADVSISKSLDKTIKKIVKKLAGKASDVLARNEKKQKKVKQKGIIEIAESEIKDPSL